MGLMLHKAGIVWLAQPDMTGVPKVLQPPDRSSNGGVAGGVWSALFGFW